MLQRLSKALSILSLAPLIVANPIANPEALGAPVPCAVLKDSDHPETRIFHLHRQLSEKHSCDAAPTCAVTHLTENTFGYTVSVGGETPFSSLGFDVTQDFTTGDEYQCGGNAGDTVCVWTKVKYLEYHVIQEGPCGGPPGRKTIRAPITGQDHEDDFYCVTGNACRTAGENYWEEEQPNGQ